MHFRSVVFALLAISGASVFASPVPPVVDAVPADDSLEGLSELSSSSTAYRTGGQGTYFYPGLGACGWYNKNSDYIVALSTKTYKKSYCGKMITIIANGKTHTAKVVDACPGCAANSLDMSPALFTKFAPESVGVIKTMKWKFNN
ncbi:hypothetical protein DL93DRAFT_2084203 [Clavulina sp. PMI_390]|nr:hypothetical protein DL93DRAFT_2084203 [Clavulina sp. PMI_390]